MYIAIYYIANQIEPLKEVVIQKLSEQEWSSYKGRMVNALASGADEGRDKLR